MARTSSETLSPFLKRATKMGLEQLLKDVEALLKNDLSPAQRIANEEMHEIITKHLEELK